MTRTEPRTSRGTSRGRGPRKDHTMTDDRAEREYARKLFSTDPHEQPTEQPPAPRNHVPREGSIPESKPTGDEAMREWTRELFDRAYFVN